MKRYALVITAILGSVWLTNAQAIPAFARKHQASCSTCHSAWPALNAVGRAYKENGYRMTRGESNSFMGWDKTVPISGIIKARPYEESEQGNRTARALHEVELLMAGPMAKEFSGFFEIEAEDDAGTFDAAVKTASISYLPMDAANVQVSWGTATWSDPYDIYSDARKLTRNRPAVIDQHFGEADNRGRLRDSRQNITVYGRPMPQLYYSVGLSGVAGDNVGSEADLISGRVAFDVTPDLMLGVTGMSGTCAGGVDISKCAVDRDFSRVALDFQGGFGPALFQGSYLKAKDDNTSQVSESNDAYYIEGRYIFESNGQPTWVPLLRFNNYEKSDGKDSYDEIVASVSYYVTENARAFLEYMDLSAPTSANDNKQVTFQFEIAL